MNEHPIDDLFRKGLGNYQAPPPTSAWQKIAAQQAQKRRARLLRRTALWLAASVLLLGLGFYWFSDAGLDHTAAAAASPSQAAVVPAAAAASSLPVATTSEQATIAQNTKLVAESGIGASSRRPVKSVESRSPNMAIEEALGASKKGVAPLESLDKNQPAALNRPVAAAIVASEPMAVLSQASTRQSKQEETAIQNIASLPLPRLAPYNKPLSQPALHLKGGFKKAVRAHWEVDLLAGFAYARQSLHPQTEEDRNDLVAREISEFPAASMLSSLLVSYRKPSGWGFRSGLSYTLLRNRFEYEQHRLVGPDSLQSTFIKSSNRIRMLEIPLLLSYELPGKRFHLALNAGPVVNISTSAKGRYLIASQQEPLLLEEQKIYRSHVGISWQAGFTAAYDLGGGNSLLIEPSFRSYPRSFTRSNYNLRETYWLAGLQIGLRHRL